MLVIPAEAGIQLAVAKIKMDYTPLLRRALRAIGLADVRFGILPRSPACAGMTTAGDVARHRYDDCHGAGFACKLGMLRVGHAVRRNRITP
ncbi:MAG TPA: hypothetical protein VF292_06070 [Rhodanobacteraceae bacterium]